MLSPLLDLLINGLQNTVLVQSSAPSSKYLILILLKGILNLLEHIFIATDGRVLSHLDHALLAFVETQHCMLSLQRELVKSQM